MHMAEILLTVLLAAPSAVAERVSPAVVPLLNAHAHNDYEHARPLFDALDRGFCSVEADVFLVEGKLLVGHARSRLRPDRTLESLYLDPLRNRVRENGGRVYRGGPPAFTLLIDLKSAGEPTYDALRVVLARYADVLSSVEEGRKKPGAVDAILSGDVPRERLAADSPRWAGFDGRLSDLNANVPAHLMPLVSDAWSKAFSWRGVGTMPDDQREKLRGIAAQVHAAGRRLRFWAAPDKPAVWRELCNAGVDLLGTDDLDGLQRFLLKRE